MIIDAHQHFWKYDKVRDAWIDDSIKILQKDFLPKDLSPILKANHVDGCITVQANQSEKETIFLLNLAEENSFIKGVVGWVDLQSDNLENRLEYFTKNNYFKGVRHILQAEETDFMMQEKFVEGISKLSKFNLTYDLLIHPHQLEEAINLISKFPNQKFVLDHIAKPKIGVEVSKNWKTNIEKLASYKNVYCKLSGLVTETENFNWSIKDFTPYLDVVVNIFGTKRILFGSDWPVCLLAGNYIEVKNIIHNYFSNFSKEEKKAVFGENAIEFYNLTNTL